MSEDSRFDQWALLELMGHRRMYGHVQEVEMFGAKMVRIDVYEGTAEDPGMTQFYSGDAVYCITPASEQVCRDFAHVERPSPPATIGYRHEADDEGDY